MAPASPTPRKGTPRWQNMIAALGVIVLLAVGTDLYEVVSSDGEPSDGHNPPTGDHGPLNDAPDTGSIDGDDDAPRPGADHQPPPDVDGEDVHDPSMSDQ